MFMMRIYDETNRIIFKRPVNTSTVTCLSDSLSSMRINKKRTGINQYMINKQKFKILLLEDNLQTHECVSKNPIDIHECQFNKIITEIYSVIKEHPSNKFFIDFRR